MMDLIQLMTYGLEYFGLYYGTYRGQVTSTSDPNNSGRVQVHCPTIHGPNAPDVWAYPISPMAGKGFGLWHVPDVGEWVHVRFDHGRVEYPMWEGGWWGQGDTTNDMIPTNVVLATKEGLKIVINRSAKSLTLQVGANSIQLTPGSVIVNGPVQVEGTLDISQAASGILTDSTGQVFTVTNGIITEIV